jgi:hypothetical protein
MWVTNGYYLFVFADILIMEGGPEDFFRVSRCIESVAYGPYGPSIVVAGQKQLASQHTVIWNQNNLYLVGGFSPPLWKIC